MALEMNKGLQVKPTSNDGKEIKILSVHTKSNFFTRYLKHNGMSKVKIAIFD
jgi:hypothetical protein